MVSLNVMVSLPVPVEYEASVKIGGAVSPITGEVTNTVLLLEVPKRSEPVT